MHILGINGSPDTRGGMVTALLGEALSAAAKEAVALGEHGATVDTIHLAHLGMPHHEGSLTAIPDELEVPFDMMRQADAFIFATPVHWFNVSALMKCYIDWLTSLESKYELQGKVAGVITHCNDDGGNQAAMQIVAPLLHMGLMIPPYSAFYRNRHAAKQSEEGWQMTDQALVGQNVVRLAWAARHNTRGWSLGS